MYATNFNLRYGFSGHLWQGRPYSCVLDQAHTWAAVRYVERNPVCAHMVANADDYPWSSARAHCGIRNDTLLEVAWPPAGCIPDWREWLCGNHPVKMDRDIRENTFSGRPCGDDAFVKAVGYQLNRDLGKKKPGPKPQRSPENQDGLLWTDEEIHK